MKSMSSGQNKREKSIQQAISGKRTKTHPSCPICYREITSTIVSISNCLHRRKVLFFLVFMSFVIPVLFTGLK